MSSTTPPPARDTDPADRSHLTVEDAGSTTDAGALADTGSTSTSSGSASTSGDDVVAVAATTDDRSSGRDASPSRDEDATAPTEQVASESVTAGGDDDASSSAASTAPAGGLAALIGDESVGHVFDQTNGVIDGLDGDSDGTAESDLSSSSERGVENPAFEQFADTEASSSPDTDDTRRTGA